MTQEELEQFAEKTKADLLAERNNTGHGEGRLSDSALATAVAIAALLLAKRQGVAPDESDDLVKAGLEWLEKNRNEDDGWGDCPASPSNVSTVALCWAALRLAKDEGLECKVALAAAETWLTNFEVHNILAGGLTLICIAHDFHGKKRRNVASIR